MKDPKHASMTHRLAAIMFTDIVGNTAVKGPDEKNQISYANTEFN